MCMKYVNVNVQCFDVNPLRLGRGNILASLIDTVRCTHIKKGDVCRLDSFSIITFINIRGTGKGNNPDNPVDGKKTLNFKVRLTKLSKDVESQTSYDLRDFSIDLSKSDIRHKACFEYCEVIEAINVSGLLLDEPGKYVIKILVKDSEADLYDVQVVHPIDVEC